MSILLFLIGVYLFVGGCFIAWYRVKNPGRLARLQQIQRALGEKQGNLAHFLTYVVLQIGIGLFLIVRGLGRFGL